MAANSFDYELFTDGACSGNPGPGGWAMILRNNKTGEETKLAGAEPTTTNNRMELESVLRGLAIVPEGTTVRLVTDSQYVGKGISEWMAGWKARGWMRKEGRHLRPVKNVEMWQALDALLAKRTVTVEHVFGHTGHPENEECDQMAVNAYQKFLR